MYVHTCICVCRQSFCYVVEPSNEQRTLHKTAFTVPFEPYNQALHMCCRSIHFMKWFCVTLHTGTTGLGMFNSQLSANLLQQQQLNLRMLTMVNAVKSPRVFDDERDLVITRFNVLQACSGVGKGIARVDGQNEPQSVDFTPENPFCKFKVCVDFSVVLMLLTHLSLPLFCSCHSPSFPPSPFLCADSMLQSSSFQS